MMIEHKLNITQDNGITKFVNDSEMYIEISHVPFPPRVKHLIFKVIPPGEFLIIEDYIDINDISFCFTRKNYRPRKR